MNAWLGIFNVKVALEDIAKQTTRNERLHNIMNENVAG
jgi:hypothetical protein